MDKVREWLTSTGLEQYGNTLEENGWDDMGTVCTMSLQDIQDLVTKPGHVRKLTQAIQIVNDQRQQNKETQIGNTSNQLTTDNKNSVYENTTPLSATNSAASMYSNSETTAFSGDVCPTGISRNVIVRLPSNKESTERNAVVAKFDSFSASSICTSTIVKDSHNVTIADKVEVHNVHQESGKHYDNFKAQIKTVLHHYEKTSHLFVQTKAYKEVTDVLEYNNWVIIEGNPGYGKSTIALHQMMEHSKLGYEPIFVTSTGDWKSMVAGKSKDSNKQFVLIDDIFGSVTVDEQKVNKWLAMVEIIENLVKERKGCLKVICTTRKYILSQVSIKFKKSKLFSSLYNVDLTDEIYALLESEKIDMLNMYFKYYKIDLDDQFIKSASSLKSDYGFPHCVQMFSTQSPLRKRGLNFFKTPLELLEKEIENLASFEKEKYCSLLMILLANNNKFDINVLENIEISCVASALKLSGMRPDTYLPDFEHSFKLLNDVFITETDDGIYKFKHDSFKEIVAIVSLKRKPKLSVNMFELNILIEYTRYFGYKLSSAELAEVLPKSCTESLCQRLTSGILDGLGNTVCKHQAWDDINFVESWLKSLKVLQNTNILNLTMRICNTRQMGLSNSTFVTHLCMNRKEEALRIILQDEDLIILIKSSYCVEALSIALIVATHANCSAAILDLLILIGADVNFQIYPERWDPLVGCHFIDVFNLNYRKQMTLTRQLASSIGLSIPLGLSICADDVDKTIHFIEKGASLFVTGHRGQSLVHIASEYGATRCLRYILNALNTLKIPLFGDNSSNCIEYLYGEKYADYFCNLEADVTVFTSFLSQMSNPTQLYKMKPIHKSKSTKILKIFRKEFNNMLEPLQCMWSTNNSHFEITKDTVFDQFALMPFLIYMFLTDTIASHEIDQLCQLGIDMNGTFLGKSLLFFKKNDYDYGDSDAYMNFLQTLFKRGLNINNLDGSGKTAISYILESRLYYENTKIINLLLDNAADVNIADNDNCIPVFYALKYFTKLEIILRIINSTNNIQMAMNNEGRNCFHFLAECRGLSSQSINIIIRLLLEKNVDINQLDNNGLSPLVITYTLEIFLSFLRNGSNPNIQDKNGRTPSMHILSLHAPDNIEDDIEVNDIAYVREKLRLLIERVTDVNIKDAKGRSVVYYVMQCELQDKIKIEILDTDLKHACDFNRKDENGVTPMMVAVGNPTCGRELFNYLLQNGANVCQLDNAGKTVIDHCLEHSMNYIIKATILSENVSSKGFMRILESSIMSALTGNNGEQTTDVFFNNLTVNDINIILILSNIIRSNSSVLLKLRAIKICLGRITNMLSVKCKLDSELQLKLLKHKQILQLFIRHGLFDKDKFKVGIDLSSLPDDDNDASEVLSILQAEGVDIGCILTSFGEDSIQIKLVREQRLLTFKFLKRNWNAKQLLHRDSKGNSVLHYLASAESEDPIIAEIIKDICVQSNLSEIINIYGETPLHVVCQTKPLKSETMSIMIKNCKNVNIKDNSGMTAMHHLVKQKVYIGEIAAEAEDAVLVYTLLELIEHRGDVDLQDNSGLTPLMYLLVNVFVNRVVGTVEVLLNNVTDCSKHDCNGNTALHLLCCSYLEDDTKQHFIQILLQKGAIIETKNSQGLKPIEMCVGLSSVKSTHALQHKKENIQTAVEHILELIERFDDFHDCPGKLLGIFEQSHVPINVQSDFTGLTFLSQGCRFHQNTKFVETLLGHGANPNIQDNNGYSSIHWLLFAGQMMFFSVKKCLCFKQNIVYEMMFQCRNIGPYEISNKLKLFKIMDEELNETHESVLKDVNVALTNLHMLLSNKADPNQMDNKGRTPLHYCAKSPTMDGFTCVAMKMLISFGADVNFEDHQGQTPLMLCAEFEGTIHRRMNILIEAGADVFAVDYNGESVPDHAKKCIAKRLQWQECLKIKKI